MPHLSFNALSTIETFCPTTYTGGFHADWLLALVEVAGLGTNTVLLLPVVYEPFKLLMH
jgi:hypothetical protein